MCRRRFSPQPITIARPVCADGAIIGGVLELKKTTQDGSLDDGDVAPKFDGAHQTLGILGIPIEMLAQICAYLQPLDLRSMSLTNHAFRRILMSRESRQLWKSARVGTYKGMPNCPDDLSEPQYTRLVFVGECFTCKSPATNIDFLNRVKSCAACFKKYHLTKGQIIRRYRGFPANLRFPPDETAVHSERPYYLSRIKADYDDYLNFKSTDERVAYEAALASRTAHALETGPAIGNWMRTENAKQNSDRSALYRSRIASIEKKLVALGHNARDISYSPAADLQLLYKLHDVTDEEWTIVRPALEEIAIKNRDRRMEVAANSVPIQVPVL